MREFISFEESLPVLQSTAWVQRQGAEIRGRLERGEEDTLTNRLRFGVTSQVFARNPGREEYMFTYQRCR